jgi:hypothetical protein
MAGESKAWPELKSFLIKHDVLAGETEDKKEGAAFAAENIKTCFKCGMKGHIRRFCRNKKKNPQQTGNGSGQNNHAALVFSATTHDSGQHDQGWFMDSGATSHMVNKRAVLTEYKTVSDMKVRTANGESLTVHGKGSLLVVNHEDVLVKLKDVLFIPELTKNLLSVPSLDANGAHVSFQDGNAWSKRTGCPSSEKSVEVVCTS